MLFWEKDNLTWISIYDILIMVQFREVPWLETRNENLHSWTLVVFVWRTDNPLSIYGKILTIYDVQKSQIVIIKFLMLWSWRICGLSYGAPFQVRVKINRYDVPSRKLRPKEFVRNPTDGTFVKTDLFCDFSNRNYHYSSEEVGLFILFITYFTFESKTKCAL